MDNSTRNHAVGFGARRDTTGLTLIEVTLFLAILTVVVVLTLGIYRSVRDQQLTAQMVYEYQSIRNSVQTLYGGIGYGTSSLNAALVSTNQLPSTLMVSGSTIRNTFGGLVTIQGTDGGSRFRISYDNVPRRLCPGFLVNATKSGEWVGYNVNNGGSNPGMLLAIPSTNVMNTFLDQCGVPASGAPLSNPAIVTLWSN